MPSRAEILITTRTPEEIRKRIAELSRFGSKGGKRSLETMTPEQRTARAKKAAAARTANLIAKKAEYRRTD